MNTLILFEETEAAIQQAVKKAKMELKRQREAVTSVQGDLKSVSPLPYKMHGEQQEIVQRVKTGNALGLSPEKALDMNREEMYGYKSYFDPKMKWYHTYGLKNTAKHVAVKGVTGALSGAALGVASSAVGNKDGMITAALTGALIGGTLGIGAGLLTPAFRYYKGRKRAHNEVAQQMKEELLKNPNNVNRYLKKEN